MQEDLDAPARKRTHNLAHDLVAKLTQSILLGQMLPGDKLPSENTIVQEHGVSRTVVREAISKLQASGLVETRHGIGTFVIERAPEQGLRLNVDTALGVRSILELRLGLETQAAALAAQRRTEQQLAQMREALDDYQRLLANNDSCVEADRRFHLLIAEATGNVCFTRNHAAPGQRHDSPHRRQCRRTRRGGFEQAWAAGQSGTRGDSQCDQASGSRMQRGPRCGCT